MNELTQLLHSNYDWARERAANALNIHNAFITGKITKEQATQLLQDILDTDELDKIATDFTVKTNVINAVNNLISLIQNVTSVPGVHI